MPLFTYFNQFINSKDLTPFFHRPVRPNILMFSASMGDLHVSVRLFLYGLIIRNDEASFWKCIWA
jgi:hypothetical protein